jgi:hypothetical protein
MTLAEAIQQIITDLQNGSADIQTDNNGQLIVYSCLFCQSDSDDHVEEYSDPNYQD